jgi:hypothetical protein
VSTSARAGGHPTGPPPQVPVAQHLAAPVVLAEMARSGRSRVSELTPGRVLVLAVLGGGFSGEHERP